MITIQLIKGTTQRVSSLEEDGVQMQSEQDRYIGSPLRTSTYSGVTDSPLCRAGMEDEETAAHELLHCADVAGYRAMYLSNPGTLKEIASSIKKMLAFLEELEWSKLYED